MSASLEDRLRAVEDKLAIFHLIASHPPAADTGTDRYYREAFVAEGEVDLGGVPLHDELGDVEVWAPLKAELVAREDAHGHAKLLKVQA